MLGRVAWAGCCSIGGVAAAASERACDRAGIQKLFEKAPAAFFEKNIPGVREFGLPARFGCLGVKFFEYGIGGLVCGLVGQSIANAAMLARRAHSPDADFAVDPPPILRTAMVWGLFMGVSSNLRYQAVFGLERLVDASIAKRVPQVRVARPRVLCACCSDPCLLVFAGFCSLCSPAKPVPSASQ